MTVSRGPGPWQSPAPGLRVPGRLVGAPEPALPGNPALCGHVLSSEFWPSRAEAAAGGRLAAPPAPRCALVFGADRVGVSARSDVVLARGPRLRPGPVPGSGRGQPGVPHGPDLQLYQGHAAGRRGGSGSRFIKF